MLEFNICDTEKCIGCGACMQKCPAKAITLEPDEEGFLRPSINENCIDCKMCVKICPQNKEYQPSAEMQECYAVQLKDEKLLKQSTSGGVFILLAGYVIEKGGVVFGAAYDEKMVVRHRYAETLEDVFPMQGSKYVQSDIGDMYSLAEKFLKNGRYVLFSSTPCQIVGLYSFLGRNYENLITLDFICSGVQSPWLFSEYIKSIERQHHSTVYDYRFRDKTDYGCSNTTVIMETDKKSKRENRIVIKDRQNVSYYVAFGKQQFLRPSCYGCSYNQTDRLSDFTCGDYEGKNADILSLGEGTKAGISVLIVHTEKGMKIFNEMKTRFEQITASADMIAEGNPMFNSGIMKEARRSDMFDYLRKHGYLKTARKYFPAENQFTVKKLIPVSVKKAILKLLSK